MITRRGILKILTGGAAGAAIPEVKSVEALNVSNVDAIVLKFDHYITSGTQARILEAWQNQKSKKLKNIPLIIVEKAELSIIKLTEKG